MMGHFSVDIICLKKVFLGASKSWHAGDALFASSATCFEISSGFCEYMVSCKGHDEFSVGFLKYLTKLIFVCIFLRVHLLIKQFGPSALDEFCYLSRLAHCSQKSQIYAAIKCQ